VTCAVICCVEAVVASMENCGGAGEVIVTWMGLLIVTAADIVCVASAAEVTVTVSV
jgi:hypothetical protein